MSVCTGIRSRKRPFFWLLPGMRTLARCVDRANVTALQRFKESNPRVATTELESSRDCLHKLKVECFLYALVCSWPAWYNQTSVH